MGRLVERLTKAAAGRGGVVLIAGEPGIGKTRLLADAYTSANFFVLFYWPASTGTRWPPCRKRARSLSPGGSSTGPPRCKAAAAIIEAALGRLNDARRSLEEATALAGRAGQPIWAAALAQETMAVALDEGLEELAATRAPLITSTAPSLAWARGSIYVWGARVAARLGREDDAIQLLGRLVPWLEHAPAWAIAFAVMACHAAEVLWLLERTDHVEVVDPRPPGKGGRSRLPDAHGRRAAGPGSSERAPGP